jgi:hypothetical protein
MRLPNHIVLDFSSSKTSNSSYKWAVNLLKQSEKPLFLDNSFLLAKLARSESFSSTGIFSKKKFNLSYKSEFFENLVKEYSKLGSAYPNNINPLLNLSNINFLRKERLYTKLKYSRSPAFDIVSGGVAALFAGLLGFLVSEKFGFELVDSGDFYYLFMYAVFIGFSIRPLLVTSSSSRSFFDIIRLRHIVSFYRSILVLIFRMFK